MSFQRITSSGSVAFRNRRDRVANDPVNVVLEPPLQRDELLLDAQSPEPAERARDRCSIARTMTAHCSLAYSDTDSTPC